MIKVDPFPGLELPFFSAITPKYKQNGQGVIKFLKQLKSTYSPYLKEVTLYADSEFGSTSIKKYLLDQFMSNLVIEN